LLLQERELSWTAADYELAARLSTEWAPHHPTLADEMELYFGWKREAGPLRGWAFGDRGFVAVAREGEERHAWFEVLLPGGSPSELDRVYAFAEQAGAGLGASEGVLEIWEDCKADLAAVRARGWNQRRRERFWHLELQPARERLEALRSAARARIEAAGLSVAPASELGGEDDVFRALWEVSNLAARDIPRSVAFVPEPYGTWKEWIAPPRVTPDRVWVAVAAGRPVGFSYLAFRSSGLVDTGFTGVLREFRGHGLARALKLETLLQAAELGVEKVETDNDSENAPIIHLNQVLGYTEGVGVLEFAKDLVG
jgi:RimJ/RimL family protein N-acetyltransferase